MRRYYLLVNIFYDSAITFWSILQYCGCVQPLKQYDFKIFYEARVGPR